MQGGAFALLGLAFGLLQSKTKKTRVVLVRHEQAVDAVGLEILKAKRSQQFGQSRQMPGVPRYIEIADTKYKLGTSDLNKIDLIKLGWMKDILL